MRQNIAMSSPAPNVSHTQSTPTTCISDESKDDVASGSKDVPIFDLREVISDEEIASWSSMPEFDEDGEALEGSVSRKATSKMMGEVWLKQRRMEPPENTTMMDGALMLFVAATASATRATQEKQIPSRRVRMSQVKCTRRVVYGLFDSDSAPEGTLAHEFCVLYELHQADIRCVPEWAVHICDDATHTETLVLPYITGCQIQQQDFLPFVSLTFAGLKSIHSAAGIVHSDLKPEHILIRSTGSTTQTPQQQQQHKQHLSPICLVDFDLACRDIDFALQKPDEPLEHPKSFRGTPDYASLLIHLGCLPSPVCDLESYLWIVLEQMVQVQSSDPNWKLPWRRLTTQAAAPAVSNDESSSLTQLMQFMEQQSWSVSSIHRAGHEKFRCIFDRIPVHEMPEADKLFYSLLARVRVHIAEMLQLTCTVDEVSKSHEIFSRILDTLQHPADTPAKSKPLHWWLKLGYVTPPVVPLDATDADEILAKHPILVMKVQAAEKWFEGFLSRRWDSKERKVEAVHTITLMNTSDWPTNEFTTLEGVPEEKAAQFLSALRSSTFLFTLPHIHLAMLLGLFGKKIQKNNKSANSGTSMEDIEPSAQR